MIKPKGVWLQTTELTDIQEAKVVQSVPVQPLASPRLARPGKKVVLIGSLALCCCLLFVVFSLHVFGASASAPQPAALNLDEVTPAVQTGFNVLVRADGNEYLAVCEEQTVAQALHQVGIELGEQDEVSLPLDTPVSADTVITVSRVYSLLETETEPIAPGHSRMEDLSLPDGTSQVIQEGETGLRENTISVAYRDGQEIDRTVIASRVLKEPGITTVAYGATTSRSGESGGASTLTVNGETIAYTRRVSVESTAYTWTGNKTATGTWPDKGTVAVDPRVIPLGTKLYVEGYGFATATDTGGVIKGNIIDVYFSTYDECVQWGRKHGVAVYILE